MDNIKQSIGNKCLWNNGQCSTWVLHQIYLNEQCPT